VSGHKHDFLSRELFGNGTRLLWIACIVALLKFDLLTKHATGLVDVGNSRFRTCLELTAEGRVLARHRARDSDRDFRLSERWCTETKASPHNSKCC
jgi:hypothetical protein